MKLSPHAYIVSGLAVEPPWMVNAGFITGHGTTLVVDAGSNYLSARTIHGYAQSAAPDNTFAVLNTEPHFDHLGGNCYFRDLGLDVHAHPLARRTEEEFRQAREEFNETIPCPARKACFEADAFFLRTRLANPNKSLQPGQRFDLGGVEAAILETPGHTPANISVFVEPDKVLFCGDCVVTGYLPNLEAGGPEAWNTWLGSLDILQALGPEIIVPGHGDVLLKTEIPAAIESMRTILRRAIREGKAPTR